MAKAKVFPSRAFLQMPLFQGKGKTEQYPIQKQILHSYSRAILIAWAYRQIWDLHTDPITTMDGATMTILSIHYNLVIGTVGSLLPMRPDLAPLIQNLLNFKFMLTEVEHGLDICQIETTATLLPDGSLDLHTPHPGAAKYMPPVTMISGMPTLGLVVLRGNNAKVLARMLPPCSGATSLDHTITTFTHVHLPPGSVIGSLKESSDIHGDFLKSIWRVTTRGLALSTTAIPVLCIGVYIAGKYSLRRTIHVLQVFSKVTISQFRDMGKSMLIRYGILTIFKATALQLCQSTLFAIAERCSAQGLFNYNQIARTYADIQGLSIAEGDILTLSIRFILEILQGKYILPDSVAAAWLAEAKYPNSLLHKHEQGLWAEAKGYYTRLIGTHRSNEFNNIILPLCQPLAGAIRLDSRWYAESGLMSLSQQYRAENEAASKALPKLERTLDLLGVAEYAISPILSEKSWNRFVDGLPQFVGDAEPLKDFGRSFRLSKL
ncbi:hypothetical protein BT96DRAFT_1040379 [Gymnopus androsaceus JB14]|uniref:Acyl-CoA dehydrogenase NM domain-like protein n=1 Tax=Gymnopus androsaceus JB14 TaxID=1447944 RepID=A0A6A4HEZ0_9AGAR|nr:hypothetical protein BT96DRAFT_1040379 [Gymnopus androsaceus JB14]